MGQKDEEKTGSAAGAADEAPGTSDPSDAGTTGEAAPPAEADPGSGDSKS